MPALRESDLANFLKRKLATSIGLLLYGNDDAGIQTALRQIVAAVASEEEPLRLDVSSLRNDPAKLDDAFRSMSLLGDRRLIVVSYIDENALSLLTSVLVAQTTGNFIVLVAGALKKDSKLKAQAEGNPMLGVVGFYEETTAALELRVQTKLSQLGLTCDSETAARVVALCGTNRAILDSECDKLALYSYPETRVLLDDVEATCGDQASFESDALCSAVLNVLITLQFFVSRLEAVSAAMAKGSDGAAACRMAKPPFFGPQITMASRLVRILSGEDLGRIQTSVQQALLLSRQMADLSDAVTCRCLLSLARMARQSRQRAVA
jgi:DNA polymerase III subunit delta